MLAVGPFGLGPFELILILAVVVIIFGVGRLPEVGGAVGKSIREFRRASKETESKEELEEPVSTSNSQDAEVPAATQTAQPTCTNCSAQLDADSKFCAQCGTPTQAAVS